MLQFQPADKQTIWTIYNEHKLNMQKSYDYPLNVFHFTTTCMSVNTKSEILIFGFKVITKLNTMADWIDDKADVFLKYAPELKNSLQYDDS